jgi:diguanylate cyclase (GGDEF)-like protein
MTGSAPGTALVPVDEFGPYDALAEDAHALYVDGFSARAAEVAGWYLALTDAAGDVATSRYLRYITAIAYQDHGRHDLAVAEATRLAEALGAAPEPVWRAKALSVVAESSTRLGEHSRAIAAMAEADWLVRAIRPGTYGHLSASTGVALSMRSVNLLEQAEVLLMGIQGAGGWDAQVLLALESAMLSAYWGTALHLIGRDREAAAHFVVCAQRALRTQRLAAEADNSRMAARGEVLEAFATMQLGGLDLAAARARAAADRYSGRIELAETYLLNLVLGNAAAARGRLDEARELLGAVARNATTAGREVWSVAAMEALAHVHARELGPHAGMDLWREVARTALERSWSEREGRFAALRDQNLLRELAARTDRIGRAVVQDPLTGLGNRRLLEDLSEATTAAQVSVVFIDVDDFKTVNDTFTHAVGDAVLRELAGILRAVSREDDVLVRFGGDEFVIVATGPAEGVVHLAHRVHGAVRAHPWDHLAAGLSVTVSVGVGRVTDGQAPLLAADGALILAKRGGRDQVVVDAA